MFFFVFFFQAEDGIRDLTVTGVQTCALPIYLAARYSGTIHLLLTDVVMSGLSGPELARRLLPVRPEARVLFMSGYTGEAIVHHGLAAPGIHYIQKPFAPEALAAKVREVLDG